MTRRFDPAAPIGYQPVEFLDIPPMGETPSNPPRVEPHRHHPRTSLRPAGGLCWDAIELRDRRRRESRQAQCEAPCGS